MTFGHNPLSWTPITHLMAETRTFNAFTEVDSTFTGAYYTIKPTGGGTHVRIYDVDGTALHQSNLGSGEMSRDEKIASVLNYAKGNNWISEDAYYRVEGVISDYWSGHDDYKEDGLVAPIIDTNGDANGGANGDLDPEPCDDANRETNADGSCASSCKTGYDFESSSADAKCVVVNLEKAYNLPLIIGGIAVLGIGAYFAFNK